MKITFMKITFSPRMALVITAAVFLHQNATATTIDYGAASGFAILAGSGITDAGGSSITGTATTGNVGLSPTTGAAITGLTAAQVGGTIYAVDSTGPAGSAGNNPGLLTTAKNNFNAAYTLAANQTPFTTLGQQLGGLNLVPGVYRLSTLALLGGVLTLNGNGQANPSWIFQGTDTLVTGSGSSIIFENGGTPCDVLWEIPAQTTLGTRSTFVGTLMDHTEIRMGTYATLDGRAWADTAVVLDGYDTITGLPCTSLGGTSDTGGNGGTTVPDYGSTMLLLGFGLITLLAFKPRFSSLAACRT
jgi:hypothetical protein